jgi:hypothetical protein
MHILRRLRRTQIAKCLPELRWRFYAAPDPPGDRMAAWLVGRQTSAVNETCSLSYSLDDIAKHSAQIRDIPPEKR